MVIHNLSHCHSHTSYQTRLPGIVVINPVSRAHIIIRRTLSPLRFYQRLNLLTQIGYLAGTMHPVLNHELHLLLILRKEILHTVGNILRVDCRCLAKAKNGWGTVVTGYHHIASALNVEGIDQRLTRFHLIEGNLMRCPSCSTLLTKVLRHKVAGQLDSLLTVNTRSKRCARHQPGNHKCK